MVAYAGASLRTQEAVLAWVGQCLMRNGALEDLTIDAICGLTAALAKMDYLNFMVYDKILDEINRRCESLTAKQYAVLLHSMASVGYRRSNALPKIGDLSLLGAREVSSVMWANATLEWKCDEHIEGIGMELCRREEGELTGIDVNNIITALAYGRGISDRKNVFWAIRCSLGRTYRPTPAYARQLSALLAQYPEVLVEFSIRELGRINGALDSYHGAKGEVKSSKMEMTVLESLAKIAHCEGFLIDDNNCDVGWYTVDVVIVNVS
ncbi:hypothetical protein FOL47_009679 [Perkinsus chesapeaki]|uniref:Uncharacterized protein n=1 Tax=Perkinsus chesapeaki TaxID=330153 RepID=A0A7J6L6X4_PERCH|nr:hypothetical protein FOL47_009679 [Perkinsus chesapeaki]